MHQAQEKNGRMITEISSMGFTPNFLLKKLQETKGMLTDQELAEYLKQKVALESVVL